MHKNILQSHMNDEKQWWKLNSALLYQLDDYGKALYLHLKDILPVDDVVLEGQKNILQEVTHAINNSFWNEKIEEDIDPKFTKLLQEHHIDMWLRNVFQKMNITTLGDLVKYKDIECFTTDYQKTFKQIAYERTNGSQLSKRTEKQLTLFMKKNKISFGMSTKLSDKVAADQEKMKKLLLVSFDLSQLENRKAMKGFGIENTSWVFTKLFNHNIENFQDLLAKYKSIDEIQIDWFAQLGKGKLIDIMQKNNLSFGMELPV